MKPENRRVWTPEDWRVFGALFLIGFTYSVIDTLFLVDQRIEYPAYARIVASVLLGFFEGLAIATFGVYSMKALRWLRSRRH